jgi:hypothetical protein
MGLTAVGGSSATIVPSDASSAPTLGPHPLLFPSAMATNAVPNTGQIHHQGTNTILPASVPPPSCLLPAPVLHQFVQTHMDVQMQQPCQH